MQQMQLFEEEPPRARLRPPRRADIERAIKREIADLRRTHRDWLTGRAIADWWGVPYHAKPCGEQHCEGCAGRLFSRDRAAEIGTRIEVLVARLNPLTGDVVPAHVGPQPTR